MRHVNPQNWFRIAPSWFTTSLAIARRSVIGLLCFSFLFFVSSPSLVLAQHLTTQEQPTLTEGQISDIPESETMTYPDGTQTTIQTIEVKLDSGETVTTSLERLAEDSAYPYQVGDRVVISSSQDFAGEEMHYIHDFVRRPGLLMAFGLFVILVLLIARGNGVRALVGLGSSFLIIFLFILPYIEAGYDPILVAIIGALFIISISFYLTHGFSAKTSVAVGGTFLALIATGLLAQVFSHLTRLTGFATEEVAFLQAIKGDGFPARGIMMAGIIIGTLGVLDDITISQASIVRELIRANPKLGHWQLFQRAMNVGKDHIASLVNTLVLVYTGTALPLLLLFMDNQFTLGQISNFEVVAEEIVKMLVGSIGLVLAVPITTALAVYWPQLRREAAQLETTDSDHGHHH